MRRQLPSSITLRFVFWLAWKYSPSSFFAFCFNLLWQLQLTQLSILIFQLLFVPCHSYFLLLDSLSLTTILTWRICKQNDTDLQQAYSCKWNKPWFTHVLNYHLCTSVINVVTRRNVTIACRKPNVPFATELSILCLAVSLSSLQSTDCTIPVLEVIKLSCEPGFHARLFW